VLAAGLVVAGLLLAGCVGPTVSDGGYRHKVQDTVKAVSAAIASARLAAELELSGKMALALTDTVVSGAESDASDAQSALESRQPPDDQSLRLHDKARQPIQDGVNGLTDLRVALRRNDSRAVRAALDALDDPARRLDQLRQVDS
jgi:hypothetical protein